MFTDDTPETITIQLTQGQSTIIDAKHIDLAKLKWLAINRGEDIYYARRFIPNPDWKNTLSIALHKIILERKIGRPLEKGEMCDHINGNRLDNREENLRVATHTENMRNRSANKNNKSGYKGAYPADNRWKATIRVNKKTIHLGYFDTPEEAHEAYKIAATFYFGEFARFE